MKYSFILVEPKVPENIGASARALKTMGFSSLILIKPCKDPEGRARWLAHGSNEILDNAEIFDSLKDAICNFDLVIATTTRKRKVQSDLVPLTELTGFIANKGNAIKNVAIVFGNEESGLSNSDLSLCHISSTIPLAVEFPSLNLSQSLMLYAYELSSEKNILNKPFEKHIAGEKSLSVVKDKVQKILEATELSDNPSISGKILERLAHADGKDLNLIHSISSKILEIINNGK